MSEWTTLKLIEWTEGYFKKHEVPNPRLDAELLLSHVLNKKRIDLYLTFDKEVPEKELSTFKSLIQRRAKREPLQYIIGSQDFFGVKIKVTPDVLIPRPETEILVESVLNNLQSRGKETNITVLDICTGSGAIIAALANKLTDAKFIGTDISEKAITVAKENISNWSNRVTLLQGDLFTPVKGQKFDIITANPPYISMSEETKLQPEIINFEPKEALFAEEDGLAIINRIIDEYNDYLNDDGILFMEIADNQAEKVSKKINAEFIKDYGGIERIAVINKRS